MVWFTYRHIINKIVKKSFVMFIFYPICLCIYLARWFDLHREIYIYKLNFFLGTVSGSRITGS